MIDKIGAGHYQTRDGDPVVILCLDAPGHRSVIGYFISKNEEAIACAWATDGIYLTTKKETDMDLRPVPRKPREVWLYAGAVFEEGMVDKEDFLASVKHSNQPGYICFREVMEDEDNA